MNTEYTGPISVEAVAQFPKFGSWNVHGDFMVKQEYENGITVYTAEVFQMESGMKEPMAGYS